MAGRAGGRGGARARRVTPGVVGPTLDALLARILGKLSRSQPALAVSHTAGAIYVPAMVYDGQGATVARGRTSPKGDIATAPAGRGLTGAVYNGGVSIRRGRPAYHGQVALVAFGPVVGNDYAERIKAPAAFTTSAIAFDPLWIHTNRAPA